MPIIYYISEEYKAGFKGLASLTDDFFSDLVGDLEKQDLNTSIADLATKIAKNVKMDDILLREIFYSVAHLIPSLEEESDIEESAQDVAIICVNDETIKEEFSNGLRDRIIALLKDKKIFYAFKSIDLITENKNVFISSKILTDIRPIFDLNVELPPTVGITQHTLHLHYQSDGAAPHKDFYISLGSNDIQELISILIRAEDKEKSLQEIYKKSGIRNLEF